MKNPKIVIQQKRDVITRLRNTIGAIQGRIRKGDFSPKDAELASKKIRKEIDLIEKLKTEIREIEKTGKVSDDA